MTTTSTTGAGRHDPAFSASHGSFDIPRDLERMDDLDDWEVADDSTDPRGFRLTGIDGEIGKIDHLLASPSTEHVHFAIVHADRIPEVKNRWVLVPIEAILLQDNRATANISNAQIRNAPPWNEDMSEHVLKAHAAYWSGFSQQPANRRVPTKEAKAKPEMDAKTGEAVVIPVIEEQLTVEKQPVVQGGVRIRSRVVEKPVESEVTLRDEHVSVHRRPAHRDLEEDEQQVFQDRTINVANTEEVPMVSKEARVVEEVVIGRDVEEHTKSIRDTVRKTEVEVEDRAAPASRR